MYRTTIFLAAVLPAFSQAPMEAAQVDLPRLAPKFVNEPGVMELNGTLIVRPLQVSRAAEYGLPEAEFEQRRTRALAAIAQLPAVKHINETDETVLQVGLGNETRMANLLLATGGFEYAEPDWTVYPAAGVPCTNDANIAPQWHHDKIRSCDAWAIASGTPAGIVAIVDTGLRTTHEDFQLHRLEGYNAVDQLWESAGGQVNDLNGHGTRTSGLAAANGNNGIGISGAGQNLSHRIMRVSNQPNGATSISVLNHGARTASDAGDRVINISYNGFQNAQNQTTGAYVKGQGGLVIWAAGNSSQNVGGDRDDDLIVVVNTDQNDSLGQFSNFGTKCDMGAPGMQMYSSASHGDSGYNIDSGTSYASPLVAATLAILFELDPSLTPAAAEALLYAGCEDIGLVGIDPTFGYGRLDMAATLSLGACSSSNFCVAENNSTGAPASIGSTGAASIAASTLTLTVTNAPANKFGIFVHGQFTGSSASGDGTLCLGGNMAPFPVQKTDAQGMASQPVDPIIIPGGSVQAGQTTYFTFWFRDSTPGGWNFSDGLEVTWCD